MQFPQIEAIQCIIMCKPAQEPSQGVHTVNLLRELTGLALSGRSKRQSEQRAWEMPLSTDRASHARQYPHATETSVDVPSVHSARTSIAKPKTQYGSYWFGKGFNACNSLSVPAPATPRSIQKRVDCVASITSQQRQWSGMKVAGRRCGARCGGAHLGMRWRFQEESTRGPRPVANTRQVQISAT